MILVLALQMPAKRRRRDSSRDVTPVDYVDEQTEGSADHAAASTDGGACKQQLAKPRAGEAGAEGLPMGAPSVGLKQTPGKAALGGHQHVGDAEGSVVVPSADGSRKCVSQQLGREGTCGDGLGAGALGLPMHPPSSSAAAAAPVAYLTPVNAAAGYAVMLTDTASRAIIHLGAGNAGRVRPTAATAAGPSAPVGIQLARGNICVRGPFLQQQQQQAQVRQRQKRQWEPGHEASIVWQVRVLLPLDSLSPAYWGYGAICTL
jgi:hypothetical protein